MKLTSDFSTFSVTTSDGASYKVVALDMKQAIDMMQQHAVSMIDSHTNSVKPIIIQSVTNHGSVLTRKGDLG